MHACILTLARGEGIVFGTVCLFVCYHWHRRWKEVMFSPLSVCLCVCWVVDLSTLIVRFSVVMSVCWVVDLSTLIVRFSVVMSVCLFVCPGQYSVNRRPILMKLWW